MIKSEMISFRAENIVQRDISQYISLVQQVYASLRQSSHSQNLSSLNNVATSIRQVVLKNDCLQQKNDILDFFFLCEKQINICAKKQSKKSSKQSKSWIKIIQKNLNNIKGLHNLYLKMKIILLKRGFKSLNIKNEQIKQNFNHQTNIDPSSIEVEQDIRLKTLYFFRWCKFIQYGKSIKKLRLKQIDDLRKSLTFNQYAVKFSYFHNWRKISKMSALNKERFSQIQLIEKKSLFNMTMESFYGLFEIKKIEQKLCQKVKESITVCSKQIFFNKLSKNSNIQKSKAIETILSNKMFEQKQLKVQNIKYQALFYMSQILQSERAKSKTLTQNFVKSQKNYQILCAKSAFLCLKNQINQRKQNTQKLNEMRKQLIIKQKINLFIKHKEVKLNQQILTNFLEKAKIMKAIKILNLTNIVKKKIINQRNQSRTINIDENQNFNKTQQFNLNNSIPFHENSIDKSLQENFEHMTKKQIVNQKVIQIRISRFLGKLKINHSEQKCSNQRLNSVILLRKSFILQGLKINHKLNLARHSHYRFLESIYKKNILKNAFKSFHTYKQMRLSHEDCLQAIQQKIINRKQTVFAFEKILEHKLKIESSIKIFSCLEKSKIRIVFQNCFYQHKYVMLKLKQMQKKNELRKLQLLFSLLKKNQQYNRTYQEEIRKNVIAKISKQRFLKLFRSVNEHQQRKHQLFYFIREQKQAQFIENLKNKKEVSDSHTQKQIILSKYLALSLFKTKFQEQRRFLQTIQEKKILLQRSLCVSKLDSFIKSLNKQRNINLEVQNKKIELQILLVKNKIHEFVRKVSYQQKHNPHSTQQKIKKIFTIINHSSFYLKFIHHAKRNYLNRWIDWKKKSLIFQKLQQHQIIIKNQNSLMKNLQNLQLSNAWNQIKSNIQNQRQIILSKQEELYEFLDINRRKQIGKITSKFSSIKQTDQCYNHLKKSIKLKYFSKFMRNSLMTKYQKVKQFCAIKSYARNLKQKSWNGLKMMLMRLRDKQNRIKTQQQLIVKIDKAMYQSRKTNKLTETIQRFNSSMKHGGLGGMVR